MTKPPISDNKILYQAHLDNEIFDTTEHIKNNDTHWETYYRRGCAYRQKGNYGRAIADLNKALKGNPRYAEAYYELAICYYKKKDYGRSWENIHKATALEPESDMPRKLIKLLKKASKRKR